MRRQQPTQPQILHLALLISIALVLATLALPATQGVAAPEAQGQPTQTPLIIVATATTTPSPTPDTPVVDVAEPNNTLDTARSIELGGTSTTSRCSQRATWTTSCSLSNRIWSG